MLSVDADGGWFDILLSPLLSLFFLIVCERRDKKNDRDYNTVSKRH